MSQNPAMKTDSIKQEGSENGETTQNHRGRGGATRGLNRGFRGGRGGIESRLSNMNNHEQNAQNMDGGYRGGYRGRGRGRGGMRGDGKFIPPDRVLEKLKNIAGPQVDLTPREEGLRKFSNACRLWIGNLPLDIGEAEVRELFQSFGETEECYYDKTKGFAFVRLDFKANAEKARQELHLKDYKGRQLKIRFSNPGTTLKIRNLSPWITNELLEKAFSVFGDIERAIVITDDRGKTTGDGILEFCKKPCALNALKRCGEGCFFLTSSPRPVVVESQTVFDDNDGMSEINLNKRNPEYLKERQLGPRFAIPGTFEYEYGLKWKQLYELFDKKKEMLERELTDEKKKIEEEMEYAKYQHETELLRDQLRQREEMHSRTKDEYEQRQREWDEHRRVEEDRSRRIENELSMKYHQQEEELRRRQEENRQFMAERGKDLMAAELQDGYPGDFIEGNWRGGASSAESWARGAGRGTTSQSWADQGWDGEQWPAEGRYGREETMAPPPDIDEIYSGQGRGARTSRPLNKFEQQGRLVRGAERGRVRTARPEQEDHAPAKRARF